MITQLKILTTTLFLSISSMSMVQNKIDTNLQSTQVATDLPNSNAITGYTDEILDYQIDTLGNVYFTTTVENKFYKVEHDTTIAILITGYTGSVNEQKIDTLGNVYFNTKENNNLYKIDVNTTIAKAVKGYPTGGEIFGLFFDYQNNLFSHVNTGSDWDLYKLDVNTNVVKKITGYQYQAINFVFDSKDNLYFITGGISSLYKVEHDTTIAKLIDDKNIKNGKLLVDKNDNIWFRKFELNDKTKKYSIILYKFVVNTNVVKKIILLGQGDIFDIKFFEFDNNYNIYFTIKNNLFVWTKDTVFLAKILTLNKTENTLSFFKFDNKNNMFFTTKENFDLYNLYKYSIINHQIIKLDRDLQKSKSIVNFDNDNNLYFIKKIQTDNFDVVFLNDNDNISNVLFSLKNPIQEFDFKIKNNNIFSTLNNLLFKINKFDLPSKPIPKDTLNITKIILAIACGGCFIIFISGATYLFREKIKSKSLPK